MCKVYIIILNWNGIKDTVECLESVYQLEYKNFEVVVVDNASSDNSFQIISKIFPNVILLRNNENLGYTRGNNIAMQYAINNGADYLWLLNNDTVVEKDALSNLLEAIKSAGVGMVHPVVHYYYEPNRVQFCGSYLDTKKMEIVYPDENDHSVSEKFIKGNNICLWGTALLLKRKVVEKIGYLKEEYFAYWEDTDYSLRSIKSGFKNEMVMAAKIYHKTLPPNTGPKRRGNHFYYYMARNRYYWAMEHAAGITKCFFLMRYFADLLKMNNMASNGEISREIAEAYLTGVNDALHGKSGKWNGIINASSWLEKICSMICSWHPYFWIDLLNGEIRNIAQQIVKRSKLKFSNFINILKSE